jgi:phage terminase small subunit
MAQLADPRLERFCREYVIDGDGNRSAQAAGYAPGGARQQACKMLKRPEVQARIAELNNRLLRDADITAERVKLELARVAFADLRSLYRADGTLKAPHEIDDDAAASISGIDYETRTVESKKGGAKVTTQTAKIRRFQKDAALRMLAQHFKIVGPEIDPGAFGQAVELGEQLERARARLARMRREARK